MNWIEEGYEERFNPSVLLRSGFDPIRSDPRFQDLVRRIGLSLTELEILRRQAGLPRCLASNASILAPGSVTDWNMRWTIIGSFAA